MTVETYVDEIFENQRKTLGGKWSDKMGIVDREPYTDRAGEGISRAPGEQDLALSLPLPEGWRWISDWEIDYSYTECDSEGWSYARSWSGLDKKLFKGESKATPSTFDMVRRRRWTRRREKVFEVKRQASSNSLNGPKGRSILGIRLRRRRYQPPPSQRLSGSSTRSDSSQSLLPSPTVGTITGPKLTPTPPASVSGPRPPTSYPESPNDSRARATSTGPTPPRTPAPPLTPAPPSLLPQPPSHLVPQPPSQPPPLTPAPEPSPKEDQRLEEENMLLREEVARLQEELRLAHAAAATIASTTGTTRPQPPPGPSPSESSVVSALTVKDDPLFAKFFKLQKMGMPSEQIKLKMSAEGLNPDLLDTPDAPSPDVPASSASSISSAPLSSSLTVKDDPAYAKFFKLQKMGMPPPQIKLKMSAEGLNPDLLDTPDAPSPNATASAVSAGTRKMTVREDPSFAKFFKLQKMGMPVEQIKLKMTAEGLDPSLLDNPEADSPSGAMVSSRSSPATAVPQATASSVGPRPPANPVAAMLAARAAAPPPKPKPPEPKLPPKKELKPNVELKGLFWSKVAPAELNNTIWTEMNDERFQFDASDLEWFFRKKPASNKFASAGDSKESGSTKKPSSVLLLDPKRQQNIGIAIARYRMPASELKRAIFELDESKLTPEIVSSLIEQAPTTEEMDQLSNFEGDPNTLGSVEKYLRELLTIPRYIPRLKSFLFRLQFENRAIEVQDQIDTLLAATDEIKNSRCLRKVLEAVLAIGNYLNAATPRGQAYGFKLDTLSKLSNLKAVDNKTSLMNYLALVIEEKSPEASSLPAELSHSSSAKAISLPSLRSELQRLSADLRLTEAQLTAAKQQPQEGDRFTEVMEPFVLEAAQVVSELETDFTTLESSYKAIVGSFGEDPKILTSEEFFGIFDQFTSAFKSAIEMNRSPQIAKAIEEQRAAKRDAEEEEKARIAAEKARQAGYVTGPEAKALYSKLIERITRRGDELGKGNLAEEFRFQSRKYGSGETSAEQLIRHLAQILGNSFTVSLVPDMAKLLPDEVKRGSLLQAHKDFVDRLEVERQRRREAREREAELQRKREAEEMQKREEEEKRKLEAGAKEARRLKALGDVQPLEGEEAAKLHRAILQTVLDAFGGDKKKLDAFKKQTRRFGTEEISAKQFYDYLMQTFDPELVGRLVPDLARLLHDKDKRTGLIAALCESAPGWARFAGRQATS